MVTVYTIHAANAAHLEAVTADMQRLGAPTVRVVDCGDHYQALEGTHRLHAAQALGLAPILEVYAQDAALDLPAFDWFDGDEAVALAGEVAGELFDPRAAQPIRFADVAIA